MPPRLLTGETRILAKNLRLEPWLKKHNRKSLYYPVVQKALTAFSPLGLPDEKLHEAVILALTKALENDSTLDDYIESQEPANLNTREEWLIVYRTAATMICHEYFRESSNGSWKEAADA